MIIPIYTYQDILDHSTFDNALQNNKHNTLELQNDLDLRGINLTVPLFPREYPLKETFDGNDYTIKGYRLIRPDIDTLGFIGKSYGKIKNLHLEDSIISGDTRVGGIVGWSNYSVINCSFSGSVSGSRDIGGIIGRAESASGYYKFQYKTIPTGIAECSFHGAVTGNHAVGGIVGTVADPEITVFRCHSTGVVTANFIAGRIIGYNSGVITNCHATGVARSDMKPLPMNYVDHPIRHIGQLVGYNMGQYKDKLGNVYICHNLDEVVY